MLVDLKMPGALEAVDDILAQADSGAVNGRPGSRDAPKERPELCPQRTYPATQQHVVNAGRTIYAGRPV